MTDLIRLRHELHQHPEISGREARTAEIIRRFIERTEPDQIVEGLGGQGLAAVYSGSGGGPRVLLRCELDALPIAESLDIPHKSDTDGVAHKCGHDGHMTVLTGVAGYLGRQRPASGSVVLLFQPAEETGEGAARVLDDPAFEQVRPDMAVALHNLPGYPLGQVIVRDGVFASASTGLRVDLRGKTSHAAEPEAGNSPALAIAQLIQSMSAVPQFHTALHEAAKVTVIHARLGEIAFGTTPGDGAVMATLRAHSQATMDRLVETCRSLAERTAQTYGLDYELSLVEPFPVTVNDEAVSAAIAQVARSLDMSVTELDQPFAWSEDFGHFTSRFTGALFGLGSGTDQPALHHPDYDFPDALIEPGAKLLDSIARRLLEKNNV